MSDVRRVLVVDRDETMREMLRALLDLEEFEVATAGDRASALSMVSEFDPDVLVIDGSNPDLDGPGLSRSLRGSEDTAHVPILLLVEHPGQAGSNPADSVWDEELVKPVSPLALIECLGSLGRRK